MIPDSQMDLSMMHSGKRGLSSHSPTQRDSVQAEMMMFFSHLKLDCAESGALTQAIFLASSACSTSSF